MPRLPIKDDTREVVVEDVVDDGTSNVDVKDETIEGADADDSTGRIDDDLNDIDEDDIEDHAENAGARVQEILDRFGYDSLEDLEEDFPNLKDLRETIGNKDAKQLIADSEYLAKVKEFWKQQDEANKREGETHDETIERLEREKKEAENKLLKRDEKEAKAKEDKQKIKQAEQMVKSFNSTVLDEIENVKDLPKEYKPFLKEFLGVDNPANEINIGLKTEVRKMAKDGIKRFNDMAQVIIKGYLEGKIKVPKIKDGDVIPADGEKKPQNLAEARQQLYDTFGVKR